MWRPLCICTFPVVLALDYGSTSSPLRVVPCSSWSSTHSSKWEITSNREGNIAIRTNLSTKPVCLTAPTAGGTDARLDLTVSLCDNSRAQLWRNVGNSANMRFQSVADPLSRCLMTARTSYTVGPGLLLSGCQNSDKYVLDTALEWQHDKDGSLSTGRGGCCGDIYWKKPVCLTVDNYPTCANLDPAIARYCDQTLSAVERAEALVAQMTLEEKASNMDSQNFGSARLGVPPNIFSEALHGMVSGCGKKVKFEGYVSTGCPTSFPQVITMGASWNRSLWRAVGEAVSDEVRGLYSQSNHISFESALFIWAPNVNPFRDPRWGRGQEVPSEDPFVCAEYAAQYIPGLQGITKDGFLKTVATVKHYVDYDLEGHGATDRQNINGNVSARDQTEYFTPSFLSAVRRGQTQSVMCSYNAVNGVPACLNDKMINGKLRGAWGFDGFVVSDCDALSDGATHQYIERRFNGSLRVQAQQGVRGGTDLNCGGLYGEQVMGAVQDGLLMESEIDVSLQRIYTKAIRLGILDGQAPANHNPYSKLGAEAVDTPAHRALALEAAVQGLVLLKNEAQMLPLRTDSIQKLALIGPHANSSTDFLGGPNYHGDNTIIKANTPLMRAQAFLPKAEVSYAQGCSIQGSDTSGIDTAVALAAAADTVILFLGLDSSIENEGHDRHSLELPGMQLQLAQRVLKAATVPVVVVLANGGPLAVRELKESAKVGAIIEAFFPGQYAGEAIMRVLLGHVSPSGLLPVTVYDADYVDRRPITNLDLRGSGGVTYRYFDGTPLWPFGFGLSYTDFLFSGDSNAKIYTTASIAKTEQLCFAVQVKNVGAQITSDVVVLGFIASTHVDAPRNPKLCDFVREAAISPGEQREIRLCVETMLPLVDDDGNERILPGEYEVMAGVRGAIGGLGAGSVIGKVIVTDFLTV